VDSKRQSQIGELIKRNFASVLMEQGSYIYGAAMVTVTYVKVSPDLAQAKIYLSIYNADDTDAVLQKIINHTHVLKQALVPKIKSQIRRIPQIFFFYDETVDEMYRVDTLFKNIKEMYPPSVQEEE